MKKYAIFALTLVLTAAVLVGCGCTNRKMESTSAPTVLPTNEEIWNTTENTTQPTTATQPSTSAQTTETFDNGNGPLEDESSDTSRSGRSRSTDPTNSSSSTENTGAGDGMSRMIPGIQ